MMLEPEPVYLTLHYPHIGKLEEISTGEWRAVKCDCSGYIDENYDAVITSRCNRHKHLRRIAWDKIFERQCELGEDFLC